MLRFALVFGALLTLLRDVAARFVRSIHQLHYRGSLSEEESRLNLKVSSVVMLFGRSRARLLSLVVLFWPHRAVGLGLDVAFNVDMRNTEVQRCVGDAR